MVKCRGQLHVALNEEWISEWYQEVPVLIKGNILKKNGDSVGGGSYRKMLLILYSSRSVGSTHI